MNNNYPQIAVLGCDSRKANLYYDTVQQIWVEHLISSCVNNEQSILEFCQQAYPSLPIGNIVRLDTVLRFENWCELISPIDENGDNIQRCKQASGTEEVVQPFRCLYISSKREEVNLPSSDCSMNSIIGTGECLRPEKWQQLASMECANKSLTLNNSIMTLDWCGLSSFRGIEFVCCPSKKIMESDYETSVDEQDENNSMEDDAVPDPPQTTHRRIIAMTLASREPNWMEDYRRWSTDPAYFADDEDANDYQPSPVPKSEESERFAREKEIFKRKYQKQIDQLKSRWQTRVHEIELLSNRNATLGQQQYESTEIEFRQEYDYLKQSASRERTRLNEVHETNLDTVLNKAKNDANRKLINAWNEKPLKTENVQDALYNYIQLLLRDRIHLVNRYERLRAVDPEQAERKRIVIHERLRSIRDRINEAINQLRRYPNLQAKIQPRIDNLFTEYDEVNQAADRFLTDFAATSSTTTTSTRKSRLLPLGRDEKKIYPFSTSSNTYDDTMNEYDYATNDEYDEDDADDEFGKKSSSSSSTTSTTSTTTITNDIDLINYDQLEVGDSDWDTNSDDLETTFDDQNQQAFINENDIRPYLSTRTIRTNVFVLYLPYICGCLFLVCLIIAFIIFRLIKRNRSYQNHYEKNYLFTEVDSCTPEEKSLHSLQSNGYENPTYKFFESQTPKC